MSFAQAALKTPIKTVTTNGMRARTTSSNALVDLFNVIGSARQQDLSQRFSLAALENEEIALRILLWARDIRGGAGERSTFRKLLSLLDTVEPTSAAKIMHLVPIVGRWDDLFAYKSKDNRDEAFSMIAQALNDGDSLCAKWMPREKGTKSALARELISWLGLSPRSYRKMIAGLTNVVENKMCAKEWDKIDFSKLPSVASARYQKAFGRNTPDTYGKYLAELKKPESERDPSVKINASALYPHDVIKACLYGHSDAADAQWEALPNYCGDTKILPVSDVSGSMKERLDKSGLTAYDVSLALGMYFADKNEGDFKGLMLPFSGEAKFFKIAGNLKRKINTVRANGSDWGSNTNLEGAFVEILRVAKKGGVAKEDMPKYILLLSDMQFDRCVRKSDDSALSMIKRMYAEAGYEVPQIVFWNLVGRAYDNTPVKFDKGGTALVSGYSPALLKAVLSMELEDFTPYNVMLKTVMNDRYNYLEKIS
jgi:hypothetical protein